MWTLLSDLAIIVMERRPIYLTVYVWNVSIRLQVNPLNKLVNFQLQFHSEMIFALFRFFETIWIKDVPFPWKNQIPSLVLTSRFSIRYILARKVWNFREFTSMKFFIDSCRWGIVYFLLISVCALSFRQDRRIKSIIIIGYLYEPFPPKNLLIFNSW